LKNGGRKREGRAQKEKRGPPVSEAGNVDRAVLQRGGQAIRQQTKPNGGRSTVQRPANGGVTLRAVATVLDIPLRNATIRAEGDLDFRGTLGVSKDAPVGFKQIRLNFELDTDATKEQIATLVRLTERYCVVYQTLTHPAAISVLHRVISR
jgi:hypothetical protein